ncbi:MAG: HDOD domain-containing protein [candidate division KSB1 bacterium]|nr:HDOD domain-containing protein [candidate division KSB1 bacterium]MDQ7065926.1 HDOD domain-containing protein [candidate division KSB1 bacterium]
MKPETVLALFTAFEDDLLQQVVQMTEEFPAPPTILNRILELTNNPTTQVEQVAEVLATEPAVAAKVLKQSNSAFYGRSRKISSIHDAVIMLGFYTIRSLVVATAAHSLYFRGQESQQLRHSMWEHSLATAIAARMVARALRNVNPEVAYIAGLLHDVGKLVLLDRWPQRFAQVVEQPNDASVASLEIELEQFGFTHPLVGAVLIDRWLFPQPLVAAVALHHEVDSLNEIPGIVHYANIFVSHLGYNLYTVSQDALTAISEEPLIDRGDFESAFSEQKALFDAA